ncbi:MAG TPA: LLM class flavin-dependent oxidoreductase [Acidimicrobiales bacterium]|nr:LLM class flavin-dependent oxidoreductase [Acidimicrobiales bacterium]
MDHSVRIGSVRIGLELPALPAGATAAQAAEWRAMAVAADTAGFGSVWVAGGGCDPCTLAGGLVPLTTTVTLGVVADLAGGRHPAVLARDLTGLDVLSGGRSAALLVAPPTADGLLLGEAVAICRALFAGDAAHLHGRHYSVDGAVNRPGPVRAGGPPLLAAGPVRAGGAAVDGWVVTGPVDAVAAARASGDRPVLWRGAVPDAATVDAVLRAGADGVVARVASAGQVPALADLLLGRWPG